MPHLVRLYIRQIVIGYAISAGFVALLLYANVANLSHLIFNSDIGWMAVLMLWLFNGVVFSGVQFALSLPHGLGADDADQGGHRARVGMADPILIPIHDDRPKHRN